jgi:hypothetical protein
MAKTKPTTAALATVSDDDVNALIEASDAAIAVAAIENPIKQMLARADAVFNLSTALKAPGILDSIMKLQGTKLGFRTDQDRSGGYDIDVVSDAVIEALFAGVMPTGNEFNIIGGNFYATREGFEGLIRRQGPSRGLTDVMITPGIPRMQSGGATITVDLDWKLDGVAASKQVPFSIKVNAGMGDDAIVGKAKRKAMAWLWNFVTGSAMADAGLDEPNLANAGASAIPTSPLEEMETETEDKIPMPARGSASKAKPKPKPKAEPEPEPEQEEFEGELVPDDEANDTDEPASTAGVIDELVTALADVDITRKEVEHHLVVMKNPMLEEGQTLDDLGEEQLDMINSAFDALVGAIQKKKADK